MEHILPAYHDPLFSILLIVLISLIIAVATYGWGIYKQQREEGRLLKFLDKFDSNECALDTSSMPYETHLLKPLTLLAKAFENAGEYHKAINIYLYLIRHNDNDLMKNELMERLGSTYLHAGFLERAQNIYEEILRKRPRNKKVLKELGIVYEMMHRFDKAEEIIEPLETLGEETRTFKHFLRFSALIHDTRLDPHEKSEKLLKLLEKEPALYRHTISVLFKLDTSKAWQTLDPERIEEILDILWFLPNSQLDLDIISQHKRLGVLYYAKGYLKHPPTVSSGIFAVDMIAKARENGFAEADLGFSYLCDRCKGSFPVPFQRCPNCMAINSIKVEEYIAKAHAQTNHSLL